MSGSSQKKNNYLGFIVPVVAGIVLFLVVRISSGLAPKNEDQTLPTPTISLSQTDTTNDEYEDSYWQNSSVSQNNTQTPKPTNTPSQNNSSSQTNNDIIETGPKYSTVNVSTMASKTQSIGSMTANATEIENTTILTYNGSITKEGQIDKYTISVPYDGRCRVDISGIKSGTVFSLYVYNELGEMLGSDGYCTNGEGVTIKGAEAGKVYTIYIVQNVDFSSYDLSIGYQKEAISVGNHTIINDSVMHTDERNVYSFKASSTGNVTMTISEMEKGTVVELYVFNDLMEIVASSGYFTNNESITIKGVKTGTHYEVQIRQSQGTSEYTLTID